MLTITKQKVLHLYIISPAVYMVSKDVEVVYALLLILTEPINVFSTQL